MSFLPFILSTIYFYISGTLFFDLVHYALHQWSRSQWRFLRFLSRCHSYHHLYYPSSLQFNPRYARQNALIALPLELACQLLGSILAYIPLAQILNLKQAMPTTNLAPAPAPYNTIPPLLLTLTLSTLRSTFVIAANGRDSNHLALSSIPKDKSWVTVGPEYHALHHVHPDRYMGSLVRVFDWIMGTSYSLRGKKVVMTGGEGALGRALERRFVGEGAKCITKLKFGVDWENGDFKRAGDAFAHMDADILVLAHGTKGLDAMRSNCISSVKLIESFLHQKSKAKAKAKTKTLPEIWYIGSEAELHPSWGNLEMARYSASKRAFLPYARALYASDAVVYRHIVPAAFDSPMGRAIVSADWAAACAMWWIRRGAWYIPVTYTGIAFLNFFKFLGVRRNGRWVDKLGLGKGWYVS
ncbi:uncharacterized protein BDV17DRAFT_291895 [Aspergillus undulatus]|uniref:uncharacterized protein n=1 Tax=Aspergillus undulatus TaxID=1810928 RepID=UPI003CCCF1C9